jgi:hypothetical protein
MMMKKQLLITLLLIIGTINVFPQLRTVGLDSERMAEYKKTIGLDTTVPDFDTKKIDAKIMGLRLANYLNYLLENYNQESYELQIAQILGEQNESLLHLYYKIKEMKFANASKQGDIITVLMNVWPDKNKADVKQADLMFRFVDGVSDDRTVNVLFSYMSRYVEAQEALGGALDDSKAVVTNSLWDNWYVQLGVDMTLMNPYGTNFAEVFPKGKAFGIDIGVGKWFRPEFGIRAKVNWENGIFKNENAVWLKKADQTHGGWISIIGDAMFNLHNLFGSYNPNRRWSLSVYPRMGLLICLKNEGSPLIGFGINNTYRLSDRWSLYADIDYQGVSSALGYMADTGTGHNGFLDINVGVQLDLGYNRFNKASKKPIRYKHAVVNNGFWNNWFAQVGVGMSLLNAYGANFLHVFPNGNSFGINMGLGKWFTPEIGLRGGFNWQNGIVGNNHMSWIDPEDKPGGNHDGGGYGAVYLDAFLNLQNIFLGYDVNKKWNTILFPRVGLDRNFESKSASPLVGMGMEQTYKINRRWNLYADFVYQVTTGEMMDNNTGDGSGSNGWFDINVGIQYELGQTIGWNKPGEKRTAVVTTGHNWPRFIVNTGASVVVAFGAKTALKAMVKEERPDHSDNKSFPSGHAAMAFAAARSIDKEFRKDCIWIPIAGYAAATAIGVERVVNKHHHWYDVAAGAAIGIGSAELTWWLSDLCFGKGSHIAVGSSGNAVDVVYNF